MGQGRSTARNFLLSYAAPSDDYDNFFDLVRLRKRRSQNLGRSPTSV